MIPEEVVEWRTGSFVRFRHYRGIQIWRRPGRGGYWYLGVSAQTFTQVVREIDHLRTHHPFVLALYQNSLN